MFIDFKNVLPYCQMIEKKHFISHYALKRRERLVQFQLVNIPVQMYPEY